jgi:acyl-ACP thioesterase
MIYRQNIEVPSYLCDINDRLHTWAAVRLCQEVTEYHGNATGIGFNTLVAQNHAWVITRAFYRIDRLPMSFDKISLATWSRGNNGLIAYRDYLVTDSDGGKLLTGTSCWAMIDMVTRRVVRLGNVVTNYENHPDLATEFETLPRLVLPDMGECVMEREVVSSMLDHTKHVNNSEYIRFIFDYLSNNGFDTSKPFSLDLSFHLETRPHERLQLSHCVDSGIHYLQIVNPRGLSVTACVREIND